MSRTPYTQATALAELERIGKQLAVSAQPGFWSAEDHHKAAIDAKKLPAMRDAYVALKLAHVTSAEPALRAACKAVGGIEANFLRLIGLDLYHVDFYKAQQ